MRVTVWVTARPTLHGQTRTLRHCSIAPITRESASASGWHGRGQAFESPSSTIVMSRDTVGRQVSQDIVAFRAPCATTAGSTTSASAPASSTSAVARLRMQIPLVRFGRGCRSGRRRSGRDFPDLMVHIIEGVRPAQRGADPIRTHRRQDRGAAPKSAGSAGGGEHDAGSFQLGLNPYPFDVTLRAGSVLPKLVWDVQHLAGLH
jgi:hypothetical protein